MAVLKNIFAIIGSASGQSANLQLVKELAFLTQNRFAVTIYNHLHQLPHFNPELSIQDTPEAVLDFRQHILEADGILISTPEYIFSIPSGLKNALEWCVATTVFANKPTGLITASAHGQKGHEELLLIMKTFEARFTEQTTWLIQGIKGKMDEMGHIADDKTRDDLGSFIHAFNNLMAMPDLDGR